MRPTKRGRPARPPSPTMRPFARALRNVQRELGVTRSVLAKRLGARPRTLSNWIEDLTCPDYPDMWLDRLRELVRE